MHSPSLPMSIVVCISVSPIHTMTIEITNDHIHLWGSKVDPEAESLIMWFVDTRHHNIVLLRLDDLNIVCG